MKINVRMYDRFIFWLHRFLSAYRILIMTFLSGFLLSRLVNELSIPHVDFLNVLNGIFSIIDRPTNILSWISLLLLGIIPVINYVVFKLYKKRQYHMIFASLTQKYKERSISNYNALAWGGELSLQTCPDLHRGWNMSTIQLSHDTTKFSLPDEYKQLYEKYFEKYKQEKRFFDDGIKYMVTHNPIAFSDSPTLKLQIKETKYSEIQYYCDNIALIIPKRDALISKAVNGSILFPHSLCMHAIVVTSNDKVLLTKRSRKVAYYPKAWACSVEEQLAYQDLQDGTDEAILKLGQRLLKEELGLEKTTYNNNNMRILSVFLESDCLNISLCAHIKLDIDSTELDKILKYEPRADYEFTEWALIEYKELQDELFHPTREYHPSSGYRMLMALIKRYGEPKIAEKFFTEVQ